MTPPPPSPAKPPKADPKARRKASLKRRLVMIGVGVGLGIVCRFVPHEYQGPCAMVTKALAAFMGVAP